MTIVLVSWSKHNILDFGYLLLLCSYFKSTTKHLVSAKIMLLVSEGVVISPPLSSLTLYGGDITPFLEHYGEGGGFPPRGWYPPLVLIWPWATGVVNNGMFLDTGVLSSRGPSDLTLFSQGPMWITSLQGQAVHEENFHLIWMPLISESYQLRIQFDNTFCPEKWILQVACPGSCSAYICTLAKKLLGTFFKWTSIPVS